MFKIKLGCVIIQITYALVFVTRKPLTFVAEIIFLIKLYHWPVNKRLAGWGSNLDNFWLIGSLVMYQDYI